MIDVPTTTPGLRADLAAVRALLRARAATEPTGPTAAGELLTLRHREVMLTGGHPEELLALGVAVDTAVARFPTWPDLRLLRAALALAVHRPDVARTALAAVPGLTSTPRGRVVLADLAMFGGDYRAAESGYRLAAGEDPSWQTTARLAALAVATGAVADGDDLYARAEDDITAKQMRGFAWVRVQRADLALALGDPERARALLADAERAYPDWWYVAERGASVEAAAGRPDRAVVGYRRVLHEVNRPEFREALGSALHAIGEHDRGTACHASALSSYLASVARGETHYLHHLAAFHADVHPHSGASVAWARQDVQLRRTGTTLSLLAWCLHRAGRREDALAALDEAFALGAADPLLRARAAQIGQGGRA